jgi:hypothetical protein
LAFRRAFFTGESPVQAASAVGNRVTHAMDSCSPGQHRFRALLALLELNAGRAFPREGGEPSTPAQWELVRWNVDLSGRPGTRYSPRYNQLVVLTDAPEVLMSTVLQSPDPADPRGVPGLRPLNAHPNGQWFRFRHVPTQAVLRIELDEPKTPPRRSVSGYPLSWEVAARSWAPGEGEQRALDAVPPMSDDAARLLAALFVRLTINEPGVRWLDGQERAVSPWLGLWGVDEHWALHTTSRQAVDGLARLLTDPVIGLADTTVLATTEASIIIGHRAATLRLSMAAPLRHGQRPSHRQFRTTRQTTRRSRRGRVEEETW